MDIYDLSTWDVVVVDDEPDNLEVVEEILMVFDAKVRKASGGQEALKLVETVRPTLVLTDLSMPGMDGYQLLYKIRHLEGMENVPVIALTAHAMVGDKERIMATGFTGYMSKPLRMATVLSDIFQIAPALRPTTVPTSEITI